MKQPRILWINPPVQESGMRGDRIFTFQQILNARTCRSGFT
ncbi:hypothetical protein [Chroococcidiopsis sp. CCNUC1]|nr:hypothetical protein [Chroococcidiopsis sp. CCNUC1]